MPEKPKIYEDTKGFSIQTSYAEPTMLFRDRRHAWEYFDKEAESHEFLTFISLFTTTIFGATSSLVWDELPTGDKGLMLGIIFTSLVFAGVEAAQTLFTHSMRRAISDFHPEETLP